jgi:SNF2 family DNA or RNA helicase
MEGYCIYKAIKPELFGNKTSFMDAYCHVELQTLPGRRQKIPIVLGYRNLDHFRNRIDPFFLGRKKQEVSKELPVLISKNIDCELGDAETKKYLEALTGILELGDGEIRDFEEHKALVALLYCQQVADSLALLKYEEGDAVGEDFDYESLDYKDITVGTLGAKEEALVDLVSGDGELEGEKVIIYTRFAKFVPRLQKILAKHKVKSVCITGKADLNKKALEEVGIKGVRAEDARRRAQEAFQDPKSDVKVIIVTSAGGVGINLQQARAMVFYNLPWTWGDYVQALGRMIRIGSPHTGVAVYHLFALLPNTEGDTKTIDHHTYSLLRKKQRLIDQILGEAAAGALDFDKGGTGAMELLRAMQESAEKKK